MKRITLVLIIIISAMGADKMAMAHRQNTVLTIIQDDGKNITKRPKSWVRPKIVTDKQNEDGTRTITTSGVGYANTSLRSALPTVFHLKKRISKEQTLYLLVFERTQSKKTFIKEDSKLLFKFEDGSMMELKISHAIKEIDNKPHASSSLHSSSAVYYTASPAYELTEEQINKLITTEVVKLRMEIDTGEGYEDQGVDNTKGWYFSDTLRECYEVIAEKEKKSNGIYDSF